MGKGLVEFWANVANSRWQVQQFQISPNQRAERASCWCGFHKKMLRAHLPGLNMNGVFSLVLADVAAGYVARFSGPYTYVGRGFHRDCCVSNLELVSLRHLDCEIANDDTLPERLNIAMKISKPCDKDQLDDAENLKVWSQIESMRSQFPRFLHYSQWHPILTFGPRSVLLVEAIGDGTSVGREMKRIVDDGNRISSREMFVLVVRYMIWAFRMQSQFVQEKGAFLQDMHMNNCVFLHGVPAGQYPPYYHGKAGRYTLFRCIDSNGWWPIGLYNWPDVSSLLACIYDVIDTHEFRSCRALHPCHFQAVKNVS